ncbi:profilin [Suillus clintonianus]|uniref:profilin n=1 Tax=Suillus clintonianus TaxID=1904413 RepID=UPI001B870ED9|nr:profilin [Suillus clintonianus]KAG2125681.1 profilin [Suillus clintonianus]
MSWQAYVDTNLVGTGRVNKAAILGKAGGVWATSPGFKISPEEQKAITAAFTNKAAVATSGFRVADQKYFFLSSDTYGDDPNLVVVQGKKGGDGAVLAQTKQAILVVTYIFPQTAQDVGILVTGLGSYLASLQY